MNISEETIKQLDELYSFGFYDPYMNEVQPREATEICIYSEKNTDFANYVGKTIKSTKKETTLDYILSKLSNDKIYKSFADTFEKLLNHHSINCYATTYGIGISNFLNANKDELKKEIETKLKSIGVIYENEYSDAGYVYRYKISKSKENIEKIKKFITVK